MRKIILSMLMVAASLCGYPQSKSLETENIGQVVLVNPDSATTLLPKEQRS